MYLLGDFEGLWEPAERGPSWERWGCGRALAQGSGEGAGGWEGRGPVRNHSWEPEGARSPVLGE